jgi:hypothetical protein
MEMEAEPASEHTASTPPAEEPAVRVLIRQESDILKVSVENVGAVELMVVPTLLLEVASSEGWRFFAREQYPAVGLTIGAGDVAGPFGVLFPREDGSYRATVRVSSGEANLTVPVTRGFDVSGGNLVD